MVARDALREPVLHFESHSSRSGQLGTAFRGEGPIVGCNVASLWIVGVHWGSVLEVSDKGQRMRIKTFLCDRIGIWAELQFHVSSVMRSQDEPDGDGFSGLELPLNGKRQVTPIYCLGMVVVPTLHQPAHRGWTSTVEAVWAGFGSGQLRIGIGGPPHAVLVCHEIPRPRELEESVSFRSFPPSKGRQQECGDRGDFPSASSRHDPCPFPFDRFRSPCLCSGVAGGCRLERGRELTPFLPPLGIIYRAQGRPCPAEEVGREEGYPGEDGRRFLVGSPNASFRRRVTQI